MKIMSVFGTRPEAIKMCPLLKELNSREGVDNIVCLTGQHRDMVDSVLRLFDISAQYNLEIMKAGQTLVSISTAVLKGMETVLAKEKPDIVLVHGDTTTAMSAALSAFYRQIPIGHVEAGLRTGNRYSPFPEEMNRQIISRLSSLHFAPTKQNVFNLEREGITQNVFLTGNTVIDALATTIKKNYHFHDEVLQNLDFTGNNSDFILMTAHRRENWGEPLERIYRAAGRLAKAFPEIKIVYPMHPNPLVRNTAVSILKNIKNVILTEPLDVEDMHNMIRRSILVLTDSGGLQEEAPSCGVPVLVLREETERPEAVEAGTVLVVGTQEEAIFNNVCSFLTDHEKYEKMAKAVNPYGDGQASRRIADILTSQWQERGKRNDERQI